ncbi:MAG: acetyl-CoA decarbonylase/synthase complex subunit delta [Candidatus Aureabacteria bacterium]|nr:acetyl-CoA decarbonylase/synthase complex subunit delta [Candidatus Auribacterota bacterium]
MPYNYMEIQKKSTSHIHAVRIGNTPVDGGTRAFSLEIGGQNCLPFHHFEGTYPNRPIVAWEVTDVRPHDWCDTAAEPYLDVLDEPIAWARSVVERRGARLICLTLRGTHPDRENRSGAEAAELVTRLLREVNVPLIIKGAGPGEKQNQVLSACAEAAQGERCLLASAVEEHYKTPVASAMAYGHAVIAETPIDVNLCKQLNILISDLHFPPDRIVIDPLTGGLGYGMEYTYSVMERIRLQALDGDAMMQMPFICFVGQEVWKVKEVKVPEEKEPLWGDRKKRGILWEIATAASLLYAGADILVMRHPDAIAAVEKTIDELMVKT